MKKGIHPENYRLVVFKDMSNDNMILTRSCAATKETVTYTDGNEYPVVKLEISNTSHPFFTGKLKLVDTAGRVDKGVHQAGFLVLRATSMPSVLIELGYINNANEASYLTSTAGVNALAKSIYNAFVAYKKK